MRKKIIFSLIAAVSILLTVMSCEANLDLPASSPDKILVMNGMVSTADTVHTIRLVGSSSSEGLFGVPDATVSIFVNDLLVDETSEPFDRKDYTRFYNIKANVKAGDKVKVTADCEWTHVEASCTMQEAPVIVGVEEEEEPVEMTYGEPGYVRKALFRKFMLGISDPAGIVNCYRISASVKVTKEILYDYYAALYPEYPYSHVGEKTEYADKELVVFNMLEPVLNPGWAAVEPIYDYNIFCDNVFDGKEYKLCLLLNDFDYMYNVRYQSYSSGDIHGFDMDLRFCLESIDEKAFQYYSTVEYDRNGTWMPIEYNCSSYPSNVSGGLGYVSFNSAKDIHLSKYIKVEYPRHD